MAEALLLVREDQWFDRKSARVSPRDLANALIGMANAEGGAIVVGLSDGVVEGTDDDPARRDAQIQATVDFIAPAARIRHRLLPCLKRDRLADHLLLFEADPSDVVHENRRDEVYLRVGDETRRLTFSQRQELLYDKGQASYETRLVPDTTIDDLDSAPLTAYARAVGSPDPLRLLQARGLAKNGTLTVAGCLLFATYPQEHLPEAYVRVLRYRGNKRGAGATQQLIADERCDGPIPRQLIDARQAILDFQPTRRALVEGGRFDNVALIPEDVWLEGLVNAVVHRSYSVSGDHVRIEIFDDRLEISSPGRFPGIVDPSDPLHAVRFARNPRIARVCADQHFGFGQELGEGIRRMFAEMRESGLTDPLYRETSGSVQLTLLAEAADRALEERLPSETRVITAALREADRLSTGEIVELLDMSRPSAIRRLRAIESEGLIRWVGKASNDPRAYWTLA
jgi:ATP-dependent DNA helicase RecG